MAQTDRFLIAPYNSGYQTNLKPWLIPDEAFQQLLNAYVWRGRVKKRFGAYPMNPSVDADIAQLYTRLRIKIGTTDGAGNFGPTVIPGNASFRAGLGKLFSVQSTNADPDEIYTVYQAGAPAAMYNTGIGTGTYNTATGAVTIAGSEFHNADVFYYPATPVTGFATYYDNSPDNEPLFAFDQQFAYYWNTSSTPQGWSRLTGGSDLWNANDDNLMWTTTYRGQTADQYYLFATNYNPSDGIRYWNGATWTTLTAATSSAANYSVQTARIVIQYENRLLLLNTIELVNNVQKTFVNRVRISAAGDPSNTNANAWNVDIPGQGAFLDAPVKQAIISAEFIKNRLIVYFETSTWELAFTNNYATPFVWQQLNTELGSESPFSIIPFDKTVVAIDNIGVHACNGSNVERIDWKIPDSVFDFEIPHDDMVRVWGIRDYKTEMAYWCYTDANRYNYFPNRLLAYNYRNGSFAIFFDNVTAMGYFQQQVEYTWNQISRKWEQVLEPWNSSNFNQDALRVVMGNQEGFTFIIDEDCPRNSYSLQITNISYNNATNTATLTVYNHNLNGIEFILIENVGGISGLNDKIFQLSNVAPSAINTLVINVNNLSGTYTGGGTITLVSQIDVLTKQYNFYVTEGLNANINKVDFQVTNSDTGEVTVEYYASTSLVPNAQIGEANGTLMGTGTLETRPYDPVFYPLEQYQDLLWHSIYPIAQGTFIQFEIFFDETQMRNPDISLTMFEMHAMCIYTSPTSRLQ